MDGMRILRSFLVICLGVAVAGSVLADVRPDRLWLSGANNSLRPLLTAAAYKALEHPDCNDVLYGRLNEYRTENVATAFTILCMKDARTTFNQVFYATELDDVVVPAARPRDTETTRAELERLRQMLGQPVVAESTQAPRPAEQVVGVAETAETAEAAEVVELTDGDEAGDATEAVSPTEPAQLPENMPPPEIF